jgi:ABC-type Fe3+-siderophore transport system permease subunit
MEVQNIVIFALLGAACLFIITGGIVSMTNEEDPSPTTLVSGAAIGGAFGAAMSYISSTATDLMDAPDMKVGLPNF